MFGWLQDLFSSSDNTESQAQENREQEREAYRKFYNDNRLIAILNIKEMFNRASFDVTPKTDYHDMIGSGRYYRGPHADYMSGMHCKSFSDMGETMKLDLLNKAIENFGFDMVVEEFPERYADYDALFPAEELNAPPPTVISSLRPSSPPPPPVALGMKGVLGIKSDPEQQPETEEETSNRYENIEIQ